MKTIKDIFSKIIKFILKITGDDLSIYAAQASFFIIISVIPFSMLVLSIIKLFINIDINSILHTINSFAPAAISTFLTETITDLFTKSGSVQVISVTAVSTLWHCIRDLTKSTVHAAKITLSADLFLYYIHLHLLRHLS